MDLKWEIFEPGFESPSVDVARYSGWTFFICANPAELEFPYEIMVVKGEYDDDAIRNNVVCNCADIEGRYRTRDAAKCDVVGLLKWWEDYPEETPRDPGEKGDEG